MKLPAPITRELHVMNALAAIAETIAGHGLLPHFGLLAVGLCAMAVAVRDTTPRPHPVQSEGCEVHCPHGGAVWTRRDNRTWPGFVAAVASILIGVLLLVAMLLP
ncbi:hypothetical protein [Prescottella equi]